MLSSISIQKDGTAWVRFLALFALCLAVFWPSLDNGFISDDYVMLERADSLAKDPFYLLEIPPENFRTTTYVSFLLLKSLFGYRAWAFYLFTMALHALSALLLGRLAERLSGDRTVGLLSSVFFVAMQNHQEAFLWLGGMHESLQGLFVLAAALAWVEERTLRSVVFYCLALCSKESAPVLLLLLPVADCWRLGRFRFNPRWLWFLPPTLLFGLVYWELSDANSLLVGGFYAFTWRAVEVFLRSAHRIAFPWLYLLLAAALWGGRERIHPRFVWGPLGWMAVSLLPYIFLTYQNHVPSRHQYLACMGAAAAMAGLWTAIPRLRLRQVLLAAFLAVNAGYVWLVKDRQFEERAAPTSRLVEYLKSHPPGRLRLVDYPFNAWTAKLATRLVKGWSPQQITVEPSEECEGCPILRWDGKARRYLTE